MKCNTCVALSMAWVAAVLSKPIPVILDTDIGQDLDDS